MNPPIITQPSMFDQIIHFLDAIVVAVVVGVSKWLFHANTRISVLETKHEDLKTLIDTRFDSLDQRLERIERALNGALRH